MFEARNEESEASRRVGLKMAAVVFGVVLLCGIAVTTAPKAHGSVNSLARKEEVSGEGSIVEPEKILTPQAGIRAAGDADFESMTDFRYTTAFGGSGGTAVTFMPLYPIQATTRRVNSGVLVGYRLKTTGWGAFFGSSSSGSAASAAPGSAICLGDIRYYYSSSQVEGIQERFCRQAGGTSQYGVGGSSSGTSTGWLVGNGCGSCDSSSSNSRRCIVGMAGDETSDSLIRSLTFVSACVLFD